MSPAPVTASCPPATPPTVLVVVAVVAVVAAYIHYVAQCRLAGVRVSL